MAYVNSRVRVDAAIIAGGSSAMDQAANRLKGAVVRAASAHRDTGAFIRNLAVVAVPGQQGTGREVTDRLVVANDPGSASIEWGHLVRVAGARRVRWVPGQHPMRTGMETM